MTHTTVEADFLRFRHSGDPDALGRVFDAVAPRMILVAAHLAPSDADDLVQATFVAAIERAERFDAARPLWPWLVGILAHEAKELRRRTGRRPDPERLSAAAPTRPDESAEAAEIAERVGRAVDDLPEPFRQVVALRVVHGLEPAQIARALGIPAATARSRLHRGLAQLRAALPAGIAGLAALTMPGTGLAAVRTDVLASAARLHAATGAMPATLTGIAMTKTTSGIAAAALVVLALSIGWRALAGRPTGASGPAAAAAATSPVTSPRDGDALDVPRLAASDARREVPHTDGPGAWSVFGQIVGEDGSHPLAGAMVRVAVRFGEDGVDDIELGVATTDAGGRYRVAADALASLSPLQRSTGEVQVHAAADGWIASWFVSERGVPADPGALERNAGLQRLRGALTGRVVDERGCPVAGAGIFVRGLDPERRPFQGRDLFGVSEEDGRFAVHFEEGGEFVLQVGAHAAGFGSLPEVALTADRVHDVGDVALRTFATVAGRFSMRDGTPAASLTFDVRHESERELGLIRLPPRPTVVDGAVQAVRHVDGWTDDDGRFRVAVLEPGRYLVRIRDRFGAPQEFAVRTDSGHHDFVLDGQLVTVRVVEAGRGPLPGVVLAADAWPPAQSVDLALLRSDVSGRPAPSSSSDPLHRAHASKSFLSPSGAAWAFHASLRNAVPVEVLHRAEPGISHVEIPLGLRPIGDSGELSVDVVDATGRALPEFEASVHMPISGGLVGGPWQVAPESAAARWPLPPGEWIVEVRPGRELLGTRPMPAQRERVFIAAGRTSQVRVIAVRAGLIRVRLECPDRNVSSWQQVRATIDEGGGPRPVPSLLVEEPGRADASSRAGDRPPSRAELRSDDLDAWRMAPHFVVPGDSRALLQLPVRVGTARLTVAAHGFREISQTVRVESDAITDVVVTMRAD
jgi:RNA polymerase sigma-70 factor (ECF subfamily)